MKINKLLLVSTLLLISSAYAEEPCIRDIGNTNYKLATCLETPRLSRAIFVEKDPRSSPSGSQYQKVTVVTAKNKSDFLLLDGGNDGTARAAGYSLPGEDLIVNREPLNSAATKRLAVKRWSAKAEIIDYFSPKDDVPGLSLVCGAASRKIRNIYVRVSQCTNFYVEDITAFHEILKTVEMNIEAQSR